MGVLSLLSVFGCLSSQQHAVYLRDRFAQLHVSPH